MALISNYCARKTVIACIKNVQDDKKYDKNASVLWQISAFSKVGIQSFNKVDMKLNTIHIFGTNKRSSTSHYY